MNLSSGFGKGVSAFAPGTDIQSTGLGDNRPVVMTGTSQSESMVGSLTIMIRL
jgi:subtilisin family serine protease